MKFICNSLQRTLYKTLMQEVQEKEAANQDPYDLVMSRQTSTVSRVAERLALLKSVFIRTRTPKMAGIIPGPYRKESHFLFFFVIFLFFYIRWICFFTRRRRSCSTRSINSKL
jgi:hypothetical protein